MAPRILSRAAGKAFMAMLACSSGVGAGANVLVFSRFEIA
jgi:hypothetical protein